MFTDHDNLSERDRIDTYFIAVPSLLSFIGCVFVVLSIALIKRLQTVTFMIIGIQMTAEALYNLVSAVFFYPPKDKTLLCAFAAYATSWTVNVTVLMTAFMSYHMYRCIKRLSPMTYDLTMKRLLAVTGLVALYATFVSGLPLFGKGYGLDGSQCWVSPQHKHRTHTALIMTLVFGPVWLCILYCCVTYVAVFKYVWRVSQGTSLLDGESTGRAISSDRPKSTSAKTIGVVVKLMYYPGIMIFCWSGLTYLRVRLMIYPHSDPEDYLYWMGHALLQLQGCFDTAVFISYATVRKEYGLLIGKYFGSFSRGPSTIALSSVTENSNPMIFSSNQSE